MPQDLVTVNTFTNKKEGECWVLRKNVRAKAGREPTANKEQSQGFERNLGCQADKQTDVFETVVLRPVQPVSNRFSQGTRRCKVLLNFGQNCEKVDKKYFLFFFCGEIITWLKKNKKNQKTPAASLLISLTLLAVVTLRGSWSLLLTVTDSYQLSLTTHARVFERSIFFLFRASALHILPLTPFCMCMFAHYRHPKTK